MRNSWVQSALRGRLMHRSTRRAGLGRTTLRLAMLCLLFFIPQKQGRCDTVNMVTSGGITVTGLINNYYGSLGNANLIGAGSLSTGVHDTTITGGTLYYSTVGAKVIGVNHNSKISVRLNTNFSNTATLAAYACASVASCTSPLTTSYVEVVSSVANNGTGTFTVGALIKTGGTFSGTDTVRLQVRSQDRTDGSSDTCYFDLSITVQKALRLTLSFPASTGLGTADFGSVNAMGIGAPAGTLCDTAGCLYVLPYTILGEYSGQGSTLFSVKFYVSTPFARSSILTLKDSAAASPIGGFSSISTSSGSPTAVNVNNAETLNRYLGLYVTGTNGPGITVGTDTAVVTYTLSAR
jgi:hypothetical protein